MLLASDISVVFEDEFVIVVDKPARLLTMATESERVNTVYALLRARAGKNQRQKIFIVHRLDREASGLLVFAKSSQAKENLQDQFKAHTAGRGYIAVVEGRVGRDQFTIRSYLAENAALRVYSTNKSSAGKLAITHVMVLKRKSKTTTLDVRLETGRKHQIRVHLAGLGHPIVGDKAYGSRINPIGRLALHGTRLEFRHPATGELMRFDSAAPRQFETL